MKLFQQLLVACSAIGLISPIAVQASDINLEEMNSYVRRKSSKKKKFDSETFKENLATTKSRIDSLEVQQNEFEAGSFSETTTMDGKVIFTVAAATFEQGGAASNGTYDATKNESLKYAYTYTMNLNSSFNGDDNLYVRLKTGNASGWLAEKDEGGYLSSTNTKGDTFTVDKIWYQFPVGDNTFWWGPMIENYYMHATTPSIYSPTTKQFTLGGNAAAYGASTKTGIGWAYNADNGFAVSSNVVSDEKGFLTKGKEHSWATQVGYTQPQFAVSGIINQKYNGWDDEYFSTTNGMNRSANSADGNSTNIGLRGWWRPSETGTAMPSVSAGYDFSTIDGATDGNSETDMWFLGLNWSDMILADDKIGAAIGQPQTNENDTVDPLAWEAYYSMKPNDLVEYRGTIFGGSDRDGVAGNDVTGYVFQTTFKF